MPEYAYAIKDPFKPALHIGNGKTPQFWFNWTALKAISFIPEQLPWNKMSMPVYFERWADGSLYMCKGTLIDKTRRALFENEHFYKPNRITGQVTSAVIRDWLLNQGYMPGVGYILTPSVRRGFIITPDNYEYNQNRIQQDAHPDVRPVPNYYARLQGGPTRD